MKEAIERFQRIKSHSSEFLKTFGVHLSRFTNPFTGFNIVAFDDYLIKKYGDYMDGKVTMATFITKKFGMKATKLIIKLIEGK